MDRLDIESNKRLPTTNHGMSNHQKYSIVANGDVAKKLAHFVYYTDIKFDMRWLMVIVRGHWTNKAHVGHYGQVIKRNIQLSLERRMM